MGTVPSETALKMLEDQIYFTEPEDDIELNPEQALPEEERELYTATSGVETPNTTAWD